jgi:pimeloyl-ACP methyl ester carboxylesterase
VDQLHVRTYGETGPEVIVLHGGPGAVGNAAPIARGLADAFRVLEPWQRGAGLQPLTVDRHVDDLDGVMALHCEGRPALVGESWGAMLGLAYAAEHPERVSALVLVGCGTFDTAARARLQQTLRERQAVPLKEELARLAEAGVSADELQAELYRLTRSLYDYDLIEAEDEEIDQPFDMRGHQETWDDMVRQQAEGRYPAAFAAIRLPVLMLHGTHDPHPGEMIRDSLLPYMPQLRYHALDRCGHSPWLERWAREEFFAVLREWLATRA